MKILAILFFLFPLMISAAPHEHKPPSKEGASEAEIQSFKDKFDVVAMVDNMTCENCSASIKEEFQKNKKVKSIEVLVDKKLVLIDLQTGENLSEKEMSSKLEYLGYPVLEFY